MGRIFAVHNQSTENYMLRTITLLLVAFMVAVPMTAQDDRLDELDFDEAPLEDEAVPYFAVGIGPVLNIAFPNLDDLNTRASDLGLGEMPTPMFQWGVEAFTAIGFVPNIRVGFTWFNGTSNVSSGDFSDITGDGTLLKREQQYDVSSSTIVVDYAFVLAKGLALAPGVGFGWSTQTISTYQGVANRDWNDYGNINTSPDTFSELERGALHLLPRVNLEYALTPFLAIRAQGAYMLQISGSDWTGNRVTTVGGVPDGISVSAFSAQVGVFVGLFN